MRQASTSDDQPILLAEDDPNDEQLFRIALERASVSNRLAAVGDGEEAIDYLKGKGRYADRKQFPLPCLLITDLKMPKCSGFDLLQWVGSHMQRYPVPAIVLSSSAEQRDRDRALALGAQEYLVKPHDFGELIELAAHIKSKWLGSAPHA